MPAISAESLKALLAGAHPPVLLHVLPEESWAGRRVPGSRCACVYEMSFLEKVHGLCPDRSTEIVVYGAGRPSLDAALAAEKLSADGYGKVSEFEGGLAAWFPVEGDGSTEVVPVFDGSWKIDPATSVIRWTGRNLFNHHEGTVRLSGGSMDIAGGRLRQAVFTIDLRSIACSDLTDPGYNAVLLRHLADRDFFETSRFPEAVFKTDQGEAIAGATPGTPNYRIGGTFTLRGVTQPLSIPAVIALNDDGQLTAQAQIEIDRTQWGVNYGSGRIFAWLGKHVVNDAIALHLKLHATRG
jgi:polyisoprenoid-binding protein YceI